jgi:acyl carrier protein
MQVRDAVVARFVEIARQQDRSLVPLADEILLASTGLDSLCFAIIVARLEDELGVDPFVTADEFPMTLGEFVSIYERALA